MSRFSDSTIAAKPKRSNPLTDSDRFVMALSQIVGKRLTYSELTGKEGETTPF